jgi:hypothetical protein
MTGVRRIAVMTIAAHAATLLFLLCYFWLVVITALDSSVFYAVFPYRQFVLGALVVLLIFLPGRNWRLKLGLLLILLVWFSLLPRVSWHERTNFFINAGTIRTGMTAEQARARMKPFLAATSADGSQLLFQPEPDSRERCVVKLKDGKVRDVQLSHD